MNVSIRQKQNCYKSFAKFSAAFFCVLLVNLSAIQAQQPQDNTSLRAPAYPLILIDPYTSAWSFADHLYDDEVRHWTGKPHALTGALRVDGKVYRFLGKEEAPLKPIALPAGEKKWTGKYTFTQPVDSWTQTEFDDSKWEQGEAAFGTDDKSFVGTPWNTKDIWVRREVTLSQDLAGADLVLEYSHDDNFELYFNGVKIVDTGYSWKEDVRIALPEEAKKTIRNGKNIIAMHCHNVTGGAYVNVGLYEKITGQTYFENTALQTAVGVTPTQTRYSFDCGPVTLGVIFSSPLLPHDLDLLSRPVNYISYEVVSRDGKEHQAEIYFEATPQWAINTPHQDITVEKFDSQGLTFLKTGTKKQNVLGTKGDDTRIDWGYFYLAGNVSTSFVINDAAVLKKEFAEKGRLSQPTAAKASETPVLAYVQTLGKITAAAVTGKLMVGYDDLYSVQYFGKDLQAWWKAGAKNDIVTAFKQADQEYKAVINKCTVFDQRVTAEAYRSGGEKYAELCALAFRQAIAAHKLVRGENNEILFFSKENFSNGSIGTVDVTYPSAPLFLCYNPDLLKGMLNPIFYYSESGKWTKPFAAHDVGTYPLANGQTYGEDMPVEESGNILILVAAIAEVERNAEYAKKHWPVLTTWATYLEKEGFDPANQLCTDDFAGHLARNANLSIKAILGLASYGKLAGMLGKPEVEKKYRAMAKSMAEKWMLLADDGDHYTLAFESKGTWSQKYNLVWDEMLKLNIFPATVAKKETQYYLTRQNAFGLPLDNRKTYTKSDWIIWTASLSHDDGTFQKFISPLYDFVNRTPDRAPLSDWHETTDGKVVGFRARSVVGGYYMKVLSDRLLKPQKTQRTGKK